METGIIKKGITHEYGAAGMKVMTLYIKIKLELMLKDQDMADMAKEAGLSYSTMNKLKVEKPSNKTYFSIAEYLGLDVNELKKLPITREEILTMVDEELQEREPSGYDVIEEAYYSEWFHGGYREDFEIEREIELEQLKAEVDEIKLQLKNQRDIYSRFALNNLNESILLSNKSIPIPEVEVDLKVEEPTNEDVTEDHSEHEDVHHDHHDEHEQGYDHHEGEY